jgi:dTDP-4-dehydrorhamnose 3,5-epimerase
VKFEPAPLAGAVVVDVERQVDERGFFARTWCAEEFAAAGLPDFVAQSSVSWNEHVHTLRGMHLQDAPYGEGKLVRCTRGAVFDVIVDVRPESATYLAHFSVRLDEDNRRSLFVPPGVAHGFLTLTERTEVLYQMDVPYVADAARGFRWDDPLFAIAWPATPAVVSERDRSYSDFAFELHQRSA